ncbi:MAG TPA: ribokinase [Anaerolineae bacterium]|nr:ribokinase [Anaerolineae bacterium]
MPGRVVVVGSLNMDFVARVPRLPKPGETLMSTAFRTVPGGKGANQAVAAARQGCQVAMVGRVGTDTYGTILLDGLSSAGVDVTFVQRDPDTTTGLALILVNDDGENTITVVPGANARLNTEHLLPAHEAIRTASVVLAQLEVPTDTVACALEHARNCGARTLLNPAPATPLLPHVLELVDFLVLNETEAEILTRTPVGTLGDARRAAVQLREIGGMTVIVTLGSKGALLVGAHVHHVEGLEVPVVDSTAAGDSFVGTFAAAIAGGQDPLEALRLANAAGALAVTRLGAQPSLPNRVELEAFMQGRAP